MITKNRMSSLEMVEAMKSGKIFSIDFIKRTNGELRTMVCRRGVFKGVKGTGMSYDPLSKALLTVWDVQKNAYRMISLDRLRALRMDGQTFRWDGKAFIRQNTEAPVLHSV
jgi:hypothetical protein